jgi:hypothetical protein
MLSLLSILGHWMNPEETKKFTQGTLKEAITVDAQLKKN